MRKYLVLLMALVAAMLGFASDDKHDTVGLIGNETDYINPLVEKVTHAQAIGRMFIESRLDDIMGEHGIKYAVASSAGITACSLFNSAMRRRPQPRSLTGRIGEAMKSRTPRLRRPKIYCNMYR